MIRVALVDDHPAVRAGLHALLWGEPGLTPVAVPFADRLVAEDVLAAEPDVALVDGQLTVRNGLDLCHELSRARRSPPVVLYSAYLDEELAIAARLAGAAGALNKSRPLAELLDMLRVAARGGEAFPPLSPSALRRCAGRLVAEDLPLLSMLVHGASRDETAATLGVTRGEFHGRLKRVLSQLVRGVLPPVGALTTG